MSCLLQDAQCNDDVEFGVMVMRMKDKYDKYWENMKKINMFIFVTVVLDPRHKLNYVKFALKKMYDDDKGLSMEKMVKEVTFELYHAYIFHFLVVVLNQV